MVSGVADSAATPTPPVISVERPMTQSYPTLFSPLKLRHVTLKNRIVFGAHTVNMSHEGIPGPRHFGYYRERARGGAAMIVVEPAPAHRTGVLIRGNFLAESDEVDPPFPQDHRCLPRPRHGHDAPALPCRGARRSGQQLGALLVSLRLPLLPRSVGKPRHERGGDRRAHRCLRRRGAPRPRLRLRRHRPVRGLQLPHRPVLVPHHQPAHRQMGRRARQPPAVHHGNNLAHPPRERRRRSSSA